MLILLIFLLSIIQGYILGSLDAYKKAVLFLWLIINEDDNVRSV